LISRARLAGAPGLTLRGWVTLACGVAACVAAWLAAQRDLFWPGLFLVLLPLASWLLLAAGRGRPRLTRTVTPLEVTTGESVLNRMRVESGLTLGALAEYSDQKSPALAGRSVEAFPLGYTRTTHRMEQRLSPSWRGRHTLGPLRRTVVDGLGLARARLTLPGTAEVLALPVTEPLALLRDASGVGTSTDSTLLKTSLMGSDDVLVREYQPGDDVRRVHWRSTAKAGELMVRREERAWDPSAAILIDNRALAFSRELPEPRFEWLVSAAASICVHLLATGFSVGVTDTDTHGDDPSERSQQGARGLLRRLAAVDLSLTGTLSQAMSTAPSGVRGQLLIALLGRLDEVDATELADARRDHHNCWALVLDPLSADRDDRAAAAAHLLEAAGWRCVRVPVQTPIAQAWARLSAERPS
jgi:uncharacterized protein (DUF58 family)